LLVKELKVDGRVEPTAVHSPKVRFSWCLAGQREGIIQSAYRVGVASSRQKAMAGDFDLWDSSEVRSAQSFDISYEGKALTSRMQCFWQVLVKDEAGNSAASKIASWDMGLLDKADWSGNWIGAETGRLRQDRTAGFNWMTAAVQGPAEPRGRAFRLAFNLPQASDITLYFATSNVAELFLDGSPVALPPVSPVAWGPPPSFQQHFKLQAGAHFFAAFLPMVNNWNGGTSEPDIAILVRADFPDGSVQYFAGDMLISTVGKVSGWSTESRVSSGWTSAQRKPASEPAPFPGQGAFLMRRNFRTEGKIQSAKLYMAALGAYQPMLNGKRVGDAALAPEWTDFREHVFYRSYDVASVLKPGMNMLGAIVGDGWYGSYCAPVGRFGFGSAPLRLQAQLEIKYADGRTQIIASDEDWTVCKSHILSSEIYDGEHVDRRLERADWCKAGGAGDLGWEKALPVSTPAIEMLGSPIPPIRPLGKIAPVSITQIASGTSVVDFGQNFAGWAQLNLRGQLGQQVTLQYAELLNPDGSVDQTNLRGARATDQFILNGDLRGERLEPSFTYHGFRYVEVSGLVKPLSKEDICGIIVHTDLEETGQLQLDQYVPQRLWQNTLWSQRSNFFGTPTDCPQRDERLGWMGDAHVFWDAACFNMDSEAFTRKFMLNVREAQRQDGSFPDIAPNPDKEHFVPPGSSPGWADAGIILPWTSWRRYGDTSVIDENWSSMERFMASVAASNSDGIWRSMRGNDYGDWLALDAKLPGDPTTPKDLVGTAMWKSAADAMVDMARATGRAEATAQYSELSQNLTKAFSDAFIRPDGSIGNGSQTGYILSLQFGLVPPAQRALAAKKLVADIVGRGKLLSTGFLGTPYSLDVLSQAGYSSLVYDLLLRTEFPSWGYMIKKDATTIWERWNSDAGNRTMNSFNHYALGAVCGFMYRRIAGIDPVDPGFARFRFNPVHDARMAKAGARYRSRSGEISTQWDRAQDGSFNLELTVPANSVCELHLPAHELASVLESGRKISPDRFKTADINDGKLRLEVGSGSYNFNVRDAVYN